MNRCVYYARLTYSIYQELPCSVDYNVHVMYVVFFSGIMDLNISEMTEQLKVNFHVGPVTFSHFYFCMFRFTNDDGYDGVGFTDYQ